jgi:hypothetical protein
MFFMAQSLSWHGLCGLKKRYREAVGKGEYVSRMLPCQHGIGRAAQVGLSKSSWQEKAAR